MGFDTLAVASPSPTPDEEHEHARAVALLETALQALPIGSREVLLLVGVEGLEHDEVATILGVSRETMRQRLSRARAQLAEKMEALEKRSNARRTSTRRHGETA